jgi:hypothetical protein
MKKYFLAFSIILLSQFNISAQQNEAPLNFMDQMQQMQKQMQKMLGGMGDSSMANGFQIDTSFNKSFGMMFDGEKWRSLTESGDSTHTDFFQQFLDKFKGMSPDGSMEGFSMPPIFKGLEQMMPGLGAPDAMPRISPENKKRKGEADTREKKYSTEKI